MDYWRSILGQVLLCRSPHMLWQPQPQGQVRTTIIERLEDFARKAKGAVLILFAYVPADAEERPFKLYANTI